MSKDLLILIISILLAFPLAFMGHGLITVYVYGQELISRYFRPGKRIEIEL